MDRNLGTTIRKYRKSAKLTQKQLAERLNKAESTVRMWELEKSKPALDTIKDISKILDIPLGELLTTAGYIDEFIEMLEGNINTPAPIPTIGEAIHSARTDHYDENDDSYDMPLSQIANKANIPLNILELIEQGVEYALSNEQLLNLAEALDVTFAYLYLIVNKDNFLFAPTTTEHLIRRLRLISSNEIERARNLSFEEFCTTTNEIQLKFNPYYEPGENELSELYKDYKFAQEINTLIQSYAFSKLWNDTFDIQYSIENSLIDLRYNGKKLSDQDKQKILLKLEEIEHEFEYKD